MNFSSQNLLLQSNDYAPASSETTSTNWRIVYGTILALGILFRVFHYIYNRSLWIDEAYLATSLINFDFIRLATPPLEYEQKAPIGFLWAVKLMVVVFGKKEMALRLIPFLCGIASLFFFLPVARYFLKLVGALVAFGVLAFAPPLIYHTVEIKQYGSELLATILSLYLYIKYQDKKELSSLFSWGLWGALLLWFSYSAIFILAGIAIGTCLYYMFRKEWRHFFRLIIPFSMWLFSFALNFFLFTYKHADSAWLTTWFSLRGGFMPLPPASVNEARWFFQAFYRFLDYPLGMLWNFGDSSITKFASIVKGSMALFTLFLWGWGMIVLYKKNSKHFLILTFPLLLTLLASGLKLYPFYERLLVFLAPLALIFIAIGCVQLLALFRANRFMAYLLPVLLLLWPLYTSASDLLHPDLFGGRKNAGERDALLYIKDQYQEGDVVYIYWNFLHTYLYYKEAYGFDFKNVIAGSDKKMLAKDKDEFLKLMQPELSEVAKYKRVWFIHNRMLKLNIGDYDDKPAWYAAQETEAGTIFQTKFSTMGTLDKVYEKPYLRVSLFNLNSK